MINTSFENPYVSPTEVIDRIPNKERTTFQRLLMRVMLGEKLAHNESGEWRKEEERWVNVYARSVSDIIDNVENQELRKLIMEEKYNEAVVIVVNMLMTKLEAVAA